MSVLGIESPRVLSVVAGSVALAKGILRKGVAGIKCWVGRIVHRRLLAPTKLISGLKRLLPLHWGFLKVKSVL